MPNFLHNCHELAHYIVGIVVQNRVHTAVHMSSIIKVNAQEKFLCRKLICGPYIMLYVVDKL